MEAIGIRCWTIVDMVDKAPHYCYIHSVYQIVSNL